LIAGLSILAHASFVVLLVLVSRPRAVVFTPTPIRIGIVSPSRLERPAPPAPAVVQPQEPAAPAPVEAKSRPVIEKPVEKVIAPSAKAMPEAKTSKAKPTPPAAPARSATKGGSPAVELPSAAASTAAEPGSGASYGTSVAAFDVDFPFAYYIEQL